MNSSISSLSGENNSPEKPKIIEVLELRLSHTGNVKAFCRVRIGALVLSGFKVVQQPDHRAWVSIPQLRDDKGHYCPSFFLALIWLMLVLAKAPGSAPGAFLFALPAHLRYIFRSAKRRQPCNANATANH